MRNDPDITEVLSSVWPDERAATSTCPAVQSQRRCDPESRAAIAAAAPRADRGGCHYLLEAGAFHHRLQGAPHGFRLQGAQAGVYRSLNG